MSKNKKTVNVNENVAAEEGVKAPVEKKDSLLKRGANKVKAIVSNPKVKKIGKIVGGAAAIAAAFCAGNAYANRSSDCDSYDDFVEPTDSESETEVESNLD